MCKHATDFIHALIITEPDMGPSYNICNRNDGTYPSRTNSWYEKPKAALHSKNLRTAGVKTFNNHLTNGENKTLTQKL